MRTFALLLAASLAFGCSKKKAEPEEKPKTEQKAEKPAKPVDEEETKAVEKLMQGMNTEEDFEDEADKEITEQNLRAEVDTLEKEMTAEETAEGVVDPLAKPAGAMPASSGKPKAAEAKPAAKKPAAPAAPAAP